MWLTLNIHCSAPVPTQTTGRCLALGSFIKKNRGEIRKKYFKNRRKLFSANANKSEVIDWDEIYTLKPNFPIFTAKKQRKTSDYEQEKVITNRRIDSMSLYSVGLFFYRRELSQVAKNAL